METARAERGESRERLPARDSATVEWVMAQVEDLEVTAA